MTEVRFHCIKCNYDLRGCTVGRCPECGREYNLSHRETYRSSEESRHQERLFGRFPLICSVCVLILTFGVVILGGHGVVILGLILALANWEYMDIAALLWGLLFSVRVVLKLIRHDQLMRGTSWFIFVIGFLIAFSFNASDSVKAAATPSARVLAMATLSQKFAVGMLGLGALITDRPNWRACICCIGVIASIAPAVLWFQVVDEKSRWLYLATLAPSLCVSSLALSWCLSFLFYIAGIKES